MNHPDTNGPDQPSNLGLTHSEDEQRVMLEYLAASDQNEAYGVYCRNRLWDTKELAKPPGQRRWEIQRASKRAKLRELLATLSSDGDSSR